MPGLEPPSAGGGRLTVMRGLIASIGYFGELLGERTEQLQAAGFDVREGRNFIQAMALLRARPFDGVIVGHAVPEHERTLLALEGRRLNPDALIVFLYLTDIQRAEIADAVINVTSGHGDLVRTIELLLEGRAGKMRHA